MRSDLRLRLREITKSVSIAEMGVTGVTGVTDRGMGTLSHLAVTPAASEINQQNQCVTPVTPRHTRKLAGDDARHTSAGVTTWVTAGVTGAATDPDEWFAYFDERAAIREYEGGLDRTEVERLALADTLVALGPRPAFH